MDTVTCPDPAVDAALTASFSGYRLCLTEKNLDFKEAAGGVAVPWAPTFRYTDNKGREIRRSVGWYSSTDFLAELTVARAHYELGRWRFDNAIELFESVAAETTRLAPEAGYYAGVALFIAGKRDMAALKTRWLRLIAECPESDWAHKASVHEDWNP